MVKGRVDQPEVTFLSWLFIPSNYEVPWNIYENHLYLVLKLNFRQCYLQWVIIGFGELPIYCKIGNYFVGRRQFEITGLIIKADCLIDFSRIILLWRCAPDQLGPDRDGIWNRSYSNSGLGQSEELESTFCVGGNQSEHTKKILLHRWSTEKHI